MFGESPVGKITIVRGPVSIGVYCEDDRDYFLTRSVQPDTEESQVSRYSNTEGGAKLSLKDSSLRSVLRDTVFSVRASRKGGHEDDATHAARLEKIRVHEEKHIVNALVGHAENIGSSHDNTPTHRKDTSHKSSRTAKEMLESSFRQARLSIEGRAKDEILAYLRDATSTSHIGELLSKKQSDGGIYDYWEKYRSSKRYQESRQGIEDSVATLVEHKQMDQYKADIGFALDAVESLRSLGLSGTEIIGLFQAEPLHKWPKVYDRVILQPDMRQKLEVELSTAQKEVAGWGKIVRKESGILSTAGGWFDPLRAPLNRILQSKWRSREQRVQRARVEEGWWRRRLERLSKEKRHVEQKLK